MNTLKYEIEKRAEQAENLSFCCGIKLLSIKQTIASMLKTIGTNEIFEQYTVHDISHINKMLNIAEWLIPETTKRQMTSAEWLMLTLSIYLHDLGMVVSKKEFTQRNNNPKFLEFKEKTLASTTLQYRKLAEDDKYLYQEFVRANHASRIREWIENKGQYDYGNAEDQCQILNDALQGLFEKFRNDLGMVCESHHKDDLEDFNKYKISSKYGSDLQETVNLNYIAIILRCADLLHITNDRTPSIERKLLDISNPTSILEWEKQKAVRAVTAQSKRNLEGNIDESITKDTIEITAYFSGADTAEAFFGLSSYLQYVKKELELCCKIAQTAKRQEGAHHEFPWKNIDESNIVTEGFEAKKLEFTIAQDNILKLLVGHTLYNDSSVVVRELSQNAIDAIKLQSIEEAKNPRSAYNGEIKIDWNEKDRILSFSDNGTGMTISDIENYLLKVGASKYRQKQFKENYKDFNPISRFGIGILTCFMVANDVDIETKSSSEEWVNILCLRNVNGKYLLKKEKPNKINGYISDHGTIIKLHIRSDIDMSDLELNLKKWIVLSEIPIILNINGNKVSIGAQSLKEVLINYLKEENYNVDDKNVKVEEKTIGNVTIACALKYNNYISDWSFLQFHSIDDKSKVIPLGTCVEGIRVEFTTPGYKSNNIFAIANIRGSKYQTNVARTALEYDSNNEALKSIYDCYRLFIEDQIKNLEDKNYSKSWAIQESEFIMSPLTHNLYSRENNEPIDEKLLIKSLSDINCLFVEKDGKRTVLSVNDVLNCEEVDILDYKIINAIEMLFKEISTDITVSKMVETVLGENVSSSNIPLITNFSEHNILHDQILQTKNVTDIQVDTTKRKIQLTFGNKKGLWKSYDIPADFSRSYSLSKKIHLPTGDFCIKGLNDEVGVKSVGGIYLNSDSELCKYLKKVADAFESNYTKENRILLTAFLGYVFDSNFLEYSYSEKDFDYAIRRMTQRNSPSIYEPTTSNMWKKN
ncbi:MAG: hypothetical protein E7373_01710 [Clostridiales bacterium]|nr:hypothetical protein [Clostridiales bacterium]